ncbi:MAG TPA: hypothetical protein VH249_17740 [Xanthobacteraceae bacterium]|nr:hypothetical protein [Xanthobacteraceae bacterium]
MSALFYVVALAGILALIMAGWGALVAAPPRLLSAAQAETSGSGAQGEVDARFAPWRITPEEAQRRFATRSSALFPPTRFPPTPENWSPPYAATAKKHALKDWRGEPRAHASARDMSRARLSRGTSAPASMAQDTAAATPAAHAMADSQMGGR